MTSPTEQESAGTRKRLAQYEARVAHLETERDSIASELAEARREIERLENELAAAKAYQPQQVEQLRAAMLATADQLHTSVDAGREMAVAKTNMQTASMWAVLGATKGL